MRRERRRSHPPMGTALCMAETVAREWNQSIANPTFCCVGNETPADADVPDGDLGTGPAPRVMPRRGPTSSTAAAGGSPTVSL